MSVKPLSSATNRHTSMSMRVKEGMLILLLAFGVFLLVALLTYHRTDPSWSHAKAHGLAANSGGLVGAWLADIFLMFFGYFSYFFPGAFFYIALMGFLGRFNQKPWQHSLIIARVGGFVLILLSGCALIQLYYHPIHYFLPTGPGGVLGDVLGHVTKKAFNLLGATLLLAWVMLFGITLSTGFSWWNFLHQCFYHFKITGKKACKKSYKIVSGLLDSMLQGVHKFAKTDKKAPTLTLGSPAASERHTKNALSPAKAAIKPQIEAENDKAFISKPESTAALATKPTLTPKATTASKPLKKGLPALDLLDSPARDLGIAFQKADLETFSREVEAKLLDFGIKAEVNAVHPGPVITRFELLLAPGVKASRVTGLSKDLARALTVESVRVVEVIPGRPVIGIEIPNQHREIVRLREVIAAGVYRQAKSPLTLCLGKDIAGSPVAVDLATMPHLLVAGTTGSGKSVGVNAMLLSLLYKSMPDEVRLIMIDPKMLELSIYEGIPHLLAPVVTDMKEAANALKWCVAEMERRYQLMASVGVRNMQGFNQKIKDAKARGKPLLCPLWPADSDEAPPALEPLPYIVVIVDEFADMIMVVGKKVEELIARIAQKARAAGIHLILATQRPSVDVITGLIKANVPTRIAFQVASRIDSRTILDQQGAEQLLGKGDMLYLPPGTSIPVRVHGAYVADAEVHQVVNDWKARGEPEYDENILQGLHQTPVPGQATAGEEDTESDPLYDEAVNIVIETRRASISSIQRRLKIGYNRAARFIEQMEAAGVVSPMQSNGTREVLSPPLKQ